MKINEINVTHEKKFCRETKFISNDYYQVQHPEQLKFCYNFQQKCWVSTVTLTIKLVIRIIVEIFTKSKTKFFLLWNYLHEISQIHCNSNVF
jgi:hypothetical protein